MTDIPTADASSTEPKGVRPGDGKFRSRRLHLFGLDSDDLVKAFFGGNATLAIIVLVLIMVFLFKEGAGFFGENGRDMELYRTSGLECADNMRRQVDDFYALSKYLTSIESEELNTFTKTDGLSFEEARAKTADLHKFTDDLRKGAAPLKKLASDNIASSVEIRNNYRLDQRTDLAAHQAAILASREQFYTLNDSLRTKVAAVAANLPKGDARFTAKLDKFQDLSRRYIDESRESDKRIAAWNPHRPIGLFTRITTFLFGRDWVTNSFYQDWYGVLPLLTGSLLVSGIALVIAVPLGIAGAIYVNQFANKKEQALIKPYIEFISAVPSVVIGFFGVVVWGQFVRDASHWECFSWIPGFPISERLNAFTAGCLLALMAIPTIFTLAEDAINNVPKSFTEAAFAVGSTRLQTTTRIVVPTAMSGIVSAVLLGFGRVIGETMVVLLCAGNRIEMPDMTEGLAAFFKPVHTMTGIVAQEMGEVVQGSVHYRALFLVGTLLFFISLLINYLAQKIMRRYTISER